MWTAKLLQRNPPVLNRGCWLTEVVLYQIQWFCIKYHAWYALVTSTHFECSTDRVKVNILRFFLLAKQMDNRF